MRCRYAVIIAATAFLSFDSPGSSSTTFSYPPPAVVAGSLFNYHDILNVSWETTDGFQPPPQHHLRLSFTYDNSEGPPTYLRNWTGSVSGSQLVALYQIQTVSSTVYSFILDDDDATYGASSPIMITQNSQQAPVLWGTSNSTKPPDIFAGGFFPSSENQISAASSSAQLVTTPLSSQSTTATSPTQATTTPSLSNSTTTSSSSQLSTSQSSSQPTTTAPPLEASEPLSTRAEIGIIIGCVIGAISLIAWIWLFITMRKLRASKSKPDPSSVAADEEPPDIVERPEGEVYEIDGRERQVELDGAPRHELDSAAKHELDAQERARELDSTARYELGVLNGAPPLPSELG